MVTTNEEPTINDFVLTKQYIYDVLIAIEELFDGIGSSSQFTLSGSSALFLQDFKLPRPPKDIDIVVDELDRPRDAFSNYIDEVDSSNVLYNSEIISSITDEYQTLKIRLENGVIIDMITQNPLVKETYITYVHAGIKYKISDYSSILYAKVQFGLNDKNQDSKLKHLTDVAYIIKENQLL